MLVTRNENCKGSILYVRVKDVCKIVEKLMTFMHITFVTYLYGMCYLPEKYNKLNEQI